MNTPQVEVLIVRHYKENRKKCTLEPLVGRPGFRFLTWRPGATIRAAGHTLLAVEGEELTPADAGRPLLILDSTWRYLDAMRESLQGEVTPRCLPRGITTAYPRTSKLHDEPAFGLASIEALHAALLVLGLRDDSLLDRYHWGGEFLTNLRRARVIE